MNTSDFAITLLVDQTPRQVFEAINNVRGWWSEEIEGSTVNLHDVFIHHYEDIHYCRLQLTEVIPDKKIVWLVPYNYFKFTKDKSEWTGSQISFDIEKKDDKTQIRFTHHGLAPAMECYDICSNAWTEYIQQSLWSLITTGKGQPIRRKDYQHSMTVNNSKTDVYAAITRHLADWWSNDLIGAAESAGDRFTIAFGNTRKTIRVEEAIPDVRVVWACEAAYIDMPGLENKAEWVGTKMIWNISAADRATTLTFLHEGLNPQFECYTICRDGWDMFLGSLQAFLTTGKGNPHGKSAVAAQEVASAV